jgi:hypothetical protein
LKRATFLERDADRAAVAPCGCHLDDGIFDMRLEKPAMISMLHAELSFAEKFMAHLLTRNSRVEADLVDQLFNSSEKRLARLLLLLANYGKERKGGQSRS